MKAKKPKTIKKEKKSSVKIEPPKPKVKVIPDVIELPLDLYQMWEINVLKMEISKKDLQNVVLLIDNLERQKMSVINRKNDIRVEQVKLKITQKEIVKRIIKKTGIDITNKVIRCNEVS